MFKVPINDRGPAPHLARTVEAEELGLVGHLVIYNLVGGRSLGGVRLVPDVDLDEMTAAARTMAYKHGFIGLPMGGAKAAIRIAPEDEPSVRRAMLSAFGEAFAPLISSGAYVPAIDMNCTLEDLQCLVAGAGLNRDWTSRRFRSHAYTAWTCFVCTVAGLRARNIDLDGVTFAVQGFGRVGAAYAELMAGAGAKLVAVSNLRGAIVDLAGFDVAAMQQAGQRKGEVFINDHQGDQVAAEDVLAADVSVLLPAARAGAIHQENWQAIGAPLIVAAANAPFDDDVERLLFEAGKTVVPDFVANCGGVLGSMIDREVGDATIWQILNTSYRRKVEGLLERSRAAGEPIGVIARGEIDHRLGEWRGRTSARFTSTRRWGRRVLPARVKARYHRRFYESLWGAPGELQ